MLLATARARADAGEWAAVRAMLDGEHVARRVSGELALLGAEASLRMGDPDAARRALPDAIALCERTGSRTHLRRAVNLLGAAHFEKGDIDGAAAAFSRALELANADGDALLVARATNNLGAIANLRGRRDEALGLYQLAIPAYQQIGSAVGLAQSFHNIAITCRDNRQLDRADEYERRAIEFAREAENQRLIAMARAGRAELCLLRGDARLAEVGAMRASIEYAGIPDPGGEADALRLVGAARAMRGALGDALSALDRAVALAAKHGSALVEAEALRSRAEVHMLGGAPDRARTDAQCALEIFTRLGADEERGVVEELLARIEG